MARRGRKKNAVDLSAPTLLERIDRFERRRTGADGGEPGPTGLLVPGARTPTASATVLPTEWTGEPPPRSRRRVWAFRWTVVLLLIGVGVAAAIGYQWYLGAAESEADEVRSAYATALAELGAATGMGEAAMLELTQPAVDAVALDAQVGPFSAFTSAVTEFSRLVRADLPATPPLAPRDALEELEPLRSELRLVASRADGLAARIDKLLTYRRVLEEAFVLPRLPSEASGDQIDELSPALAQVISDSVGALNRLPTDPFLDAHRLQAEETLEFMRNWETDYLAALRTGNQSRAEVLGIGMNREVSEMRAAIADPLADFRAWALAEFAGLRSDVAAKEILVGPTTTEGTS